MSIVLDDIDQLNETSIDLINITAQEIRGKERAATNLTKKEKIRIWDMVPPGETKFHETDRSTRTVLTTVHSLLMIISWVVLIPTAILIARYTRSSWPNRNFLGSPLWLNAHRFLNFTAAVFTGISIFCIFYAHGFKWHGLDILNGYNVSLKNLTTNN